MTPRCIFALAISLLPLATLAAAPQFYGGFGYRIQIPPGWNYIEPKDQDGVLLLLSYPKEHMQPLIPDGQAEIYIKVVKFMPDDHSLAGALYRSLRRESQQACTSFLHFSDTKSAIRVTYPDRLTHKHLDYFLSARGEEYIFTLSRALNANCGQHEKTMQEIIQSLRPWPLRPGR